MGYPRKWGKYCDLGHITSTFCRSVLGESLPGHPEGKTIFALDVEVPTNTLTHLLAPGVYRLLLRIAARNAGPVENKVQISFSGDWYDNEETMLRDGVNVSLIEID